MDIERVTRSHFKPKEEASWRNDVAVRHRCGNPKRAESNVTE